MGTLGILVQQPVVVVSVDLSVVVGVLGVTLIVVWIYFEVLVVGVGLRYRLGLMLVGEGERRTRNS